MQRRVSFDLLRLDRMFKRSEKWEKRVLMNVSGCDMFLQIEEVGYFEGDLKSSLSEKINK